MLKSLDCEIFYSLREGGAECKNIKYRDTGLLVISKKPDTIASADEWAEKGNKGLWGRPNFMAVYFDPENSVLLQAHIVNAMNATAPFS